MPTPPRELSLVLIERAVLINVLGPTGLVLLLSPPHPTPRLVSFSAYTVSRVVLTISSLLSEISRKLDARAFMFHIVLHSTVDTFETRCFFFPFPLFPRAVCGWMAEDANLVSRLDPAVLS